MDNGLVSNSFQVFLNEAPEHSKASAILLGLPAVGNKVVKNLPIALDAFDEV